MRTGIPEIVARLLRDPLAQRFARRSFSTGNNKVYTADDVLGERIVRMAALLQWEEVRPGYVMSGFPPPSEIRAKTIVAMIYNVLTAMPYLWTEEVRAGLRGVELPRHVLSPRILPNPCSWHTFETGIGIGGHLDYEGRRYVDGTVDALFVGDTVKGLVVVQFGEMLDAETGEPRPCVMSTGDASINYGDIYPDAFGDPFRNIVQTVLTLFTFLNSPYIPKRQVKASRSARREGQRLGSPIDDQLVTFVVLRRPATKNHATDEERSVDWKHRWLVNGHVRAQWYPSERAHRLIWIAPYLKGPEDAPMLEHAYKVAR